jgi:hypothetical protein
VPNCSTTPAPSAKDKLHQLISCIVVCMLSDTTFPRNIWEIRQLAVSSRSNISIHGVDSLNITHHEIKYHIYSWTRSIINSFTPTHCHSSTHSRHQTYTEHTHTHTRSHVRIRTYAHAYAHTHTHDRAYHACMRTTHCPAPGNPGLATSCTRSTEDGPNSDTSTAGIISISVEGPVERDLGHLRERLREMKREGESMVEVGGVPVCMNECEKCVGVSEWEWGGNKTHEPSVREVWY